ncbi:MAG: hypothetical protein WC503_06930 [Candidatus Shapirobacteria bacterium]
MKNNFVKIVFCLGVGFMMLGYFKMRTSTTGDIRMIVQAAHVCLSTYCNSGSGCTSPSVCYSADALTCACVTPYCTTAMSLTCSTTGRTCIPSLAGGYCSPYPTSTPTVTPTPTPYQDCNNDGFCVQPPPVACYYVCHSCDYSGCYDDPIDWTRCTSGVYAKSRIDCYSGTCATACSKTEVGSTSTCQWCPLFTVVATPPPPVPTACSAYACTTVTGPTALCPYFNPATTCVADGGLGSCDNCGGMDCGPCGGAAPTNTPAPTSPPGSTPTPVPPTPTPGCVTDCVNDPCRTNICSDQTCLDTCGTTYCIGAKTPCAIPTFNSLVIKNASSVVVAADVSNRNHICEASFFNNASPRTVIYDVNVSDLDGFGTITRVDLRWNEGVGVGKTMAYVTGSGSGNTAIYRLSVTYASGSNNSGIYPIEIRITDEDNRTSDWVSSNRNWKVWDCQVQVSGSLYDGSSGQVCNNTGFTNLVDIDLNFRNLLFSNVSAGVSATPILPNRFGSNTLTWSRTYLPIFNNGTALNPNGDLSASGRMTRVTDVGAGGTVSCPTTDQFNLYDKVSAYSVGMTAVIDFSFVRSQEGWFQVTGSGVKAKNQLVSGVPVTMPLASRALTLSRVGADNGLVSFASYVNNNGYVSNSAYGITNNWWIQRNTNDVTTYSYQYLYNNIFINRDIGVTGTNWAGKPATSVGGVYFVNGNLLINSNYDLDAGKTVLVIVKGKITIDPTVSLLDGIYIADGGIEATGESAAQLVINGSLYSKATIQLARSYVNKLTNNTSPAVMVNYQPDLIFNMPGTLMRVLSGWREE